MCGFSGILYGDLNKIVDRLMLGKMTDSITHRGPDDEGFFIKDNIGFGFRRLSIIDLKGGHQPMTDNSNQAWIVFNGEIYNYLDIKKDLIEKGFVFNTNSDTEVVLNAYLCYGNAFVEKLRGMFAFAIYDLKKRITILGRDHFGIKPLYYSLNKNTLVFSSELKSIVTTGLITREIDFNAVDCYFSYGYIANDLTIYSDVKKLLPGHIIIFEQKDNVIIAETKNFFSPKFTPNYSYTFDEYKLEIKNKLQQTVKAHLLSDVPVGAFLSGGIDSNAVVSIMAKLYPEKIKTFTIGFNESGFDEAVLAKKSAAFYGTQHHELYLEPESASIIDKLVDIYDEPFADSSAIPTYFLSKLAAQHVKVVLSGDGGDELFGGYGTYQRLKKLNSYRYILNPVRPLFKALASYMNDGVKGKRFINMLSKDPEHMYAYFMQVDNEEKKKLYTNDVFDLVSNNFASQIKVKKIIQSKSNPFISKMMELDLTTYMPDDILVKVDRASMANSLEVRVPLIDVDFFDLASRIPFEMKMNKIGGKFIFKEAIKDIIPDYIYNKPKSGFTIPIHKWMKKDLNDFIKQSLLELKTTQIINPQYIDNILKMDDLRGMATRVWPLVMFSRWYSKNKI